MKRRHPPHARTAQPSAQARQRIACAHALFEVRAYLLTRCANSPQARRLAAACERAADLLCPRDSEGDD
jgi:hypothetical protein